MSRPYLQFDVPMPSANLGNARWHHMERDRLRKSYMTKLDVLRMRRGFPKRWPGEVPERVEFRVHARVYNLMDPDGLTYRCKWLLDWLVRRGYLVDDRPQHLLWRIMPSQEIDRNNYGRFHVRLLAVPERSWRDDPSALCG